MMEKLVYERPIMRAELFRTNAYAEGCAREVDSKTDYIKYLLNSVTLIFDITKHDTINMETGKSEYYYKQTAENDAAVDGNMYFLEYSQQRNDFNLYQDRDNSGYGAKEIYGIPNLAGNKTQVSGRGTLQSSGAFGYTGSWCESPYNPSGTTNNWYMPDKLIKRDITYDQFTETKWIMSF